MNRPANRRAVSITFYLHRVPFVIVHAQYDLDILRRLFFTAVKLSLQQGDVKVVPHVTWNISTNPVFTRPVKKDHLADVGASNATWEDDLWEAHFPHDSRAAVHKVGEVLPDLGEVPGEKLQGHEQAWQGNGVGKLKEADPGGRWIRTQSAGDALASYLGLCA